MQGPCSLQRIHFNVASVQVIFYIEEKTKIIISDRLIFLYWQGCCVLELLCRNVEIPHWEYFQINAQEIILNAKIFCLYSEQTRKRKEKNNIRSTILQ